ncbi:MAG: GNAT family N-acetyltransferase [Maricaulaceae bacterium]
MTPRLADTRDLSALVDVLSQAFADDPVLTWSFGPNVSVATIFREMIAGCYLRLGFAHMVDGAAASLWLPSGRTPHLPAHRELRIGLTALRSGGLSALRRALKVAGIVERSHPKTPHYYLFAIGVSPDRQGQGLGRRLLLEGLAMADQDRAPVYLENSRPRNARFYESCGFRAREPIALPEGAPPLIPMWREGRRGLTGVRNGTP